MLFEGENGKVLATIPFDGIPQRVSVQSMQNMPFVPSEGSLGAVPQGAYCQNMPFENVSQGFSTQNLPFMGFPSQNASSGSPQGGEGEVSFENTLGFCKTGPGVLEISSADVSAPPTEA